MVADKIREIINIEKEALETLQATYEARFFSLPANEAGEVDADELLKLNRRFAALEAKIKERTAKSLKLFESQEV